jgi:DNA-binding NtrC family response regulator
MVSILIVDDSPDNLSILKDFLITRSYWVTECSSGYRARSILKHEHFDLVISDYQMPDGDGLWLLEETQKLATPPKVIMLSGDKDLNPIVFQNKGALALLPRPIDWKKLEQLIQNLNLK